MSDCDETACTSYLNEFFELMSNYTKKNETTEGAVDKKYIRDTTWMMNIVTQMLDNMLKLCETSYELHLLLKFQSLSTYNALFLTSI